ncbi:MAG: hypothetical protein AAFU79_12025, partial [Myxococcota bacterium]
MEQSWYQRLVLVVVLLAGAIYYSAPSVIYFGLGPEDRRSTKAVDAAIPDWLPDNRFNFGIDLQGGLHLVMGVDSEKAVQDTADRVASDIYEQMEEKGKLLERARREGDAPEITFAMKTDADWPEMKTLLDDYRDSWTVLNRSGATVVLGMLPERQDQIRKDAVEQALKTIRNRIDQTGTKEPEVRTRGDNSI